MGARMFGWGSRDDDPTGCTDVHDDLFVRALWLRDNGGDVLILEFDLLLFSRDVADRLRGAVGRRFGLTMDRIVLNTSHTHNGPTTGTWWTALYSAPDAIYLDALEYAVLSSANKARDSLSDVTVHPGQTTTDLAVSRRKPDGHGGVIWEANKENTIYNLVPFCAFKNDDGQVVCLLFSVSCHPSVVSGFDISADYPGEAMAALDARLGGECSLFLQGVGGDTKVRAHDDVAVFGTTWEDQATAGVSVAEAITKELASELREVTPKLRVCELEVELALRPPPSGQDGSPDHKSDVRQRWAERMKEREASGIPIPTAVRMTVHGVQIGEGVRLVGLEGEAVADLGYLIKDEFDGGVTFPLGHTDGCQMYIPSDQMLDEGGYEVVSYYEYHQPAGLAPGIDSAVTDGVRELQRYGVG